MLAELSNLIRRLIGENIQMKMLHGRDLGMVKADQGQLEQVVINLAVNARDAMKRRHADHPHQQRHQSTSPECPANADLIAPDGGRQSSSPAITCWSK